MGCRSTGSGWPGIAGAPSRPATVVSQGWSTLDGFASDFDAEGVGGCRRRVTVRDGGRLIDRLTSNEMEELDPEELQAAAQASATSGPGSTNKFV